MARPPAVYNRRMRAREGLKRLLGPRWLLRLRGWRDGTPLPHWGNLRRTRPFSERFGLDRGTPVDRHYLHRFFERNAGRITGDVLEVHRPLYTTRFGSAVRTSDTVDIDPGVRPTYVCDLAAPGDTIPAARYDCFLLHNTLQLIRDLEAALRTAARVVRPGGVVLAATPVLMPLESAADDYWRPTAAGWRTLAARAWPGCEVSVAAHGNCLVAVAAMLGLATEELTEAELAAEDPLYPVLVTAVCRTPTA
jgi:SAM-dependent methyltransferase